MKKLITIVVFQFIALAGFTQLNVSRLLCNNLSNPTGIEVSSPQFSWQLNSDKRNPLARVLNSAI